MAGREWVQTIASFALLWKGCSPRFAAPLGGSQACLRETDGRFWKRLMIGKLTVQVVPFATTRVNRKPSQISPWSERPKREEKKLVVTSLRKWDKRFCFPKGTWAWSKSAFYVARFGTFSPPIVMLQTHTSVQVSIGKLILATRKLSSLLMWGCMDDKCF